MTLALKTNKLLSRFAKKMPQAAPYPWYLVCSLYLLMMHPSGDAAALDAILEPIAPSVRKWASVVVVDGEESSPDFRWYHYRDSEHAIDFWPASTIKIYTAVAALEYLNQLGVSSDSALIFEHQVGDHWQVDAARTPREMISEVFRRSSNEDYTLLLRFVGIDRINTQFLIPEKGFPHSALMRDYVVHRPVVYENTEPQRIRIVEPDGKHREVTHSWTGISYARQRGATILSDTTGNATSTRELAECLRRILFAEVLPPEEKYQLTNQQLGWIRHGEDGLVGLENKSAGPYAWKDAIETLLPRARYFHKAGLISNYVLDVAYVEDEALNVKFILSLAAHTGDGKVIGQMAKALTRWILQQKAIPTTKEDSTQER